MMKTDDKHGLIFGFKPAVLSFCLFVCLLAGACQTMVSPVGNLQKTPTPTATRTPEAKETNDDFAEKLEYVQKGAFLFVYVFRRKDGAPLDSEDRSYLRMNSPMETNQWVVTDDARAAIAGSNYQFAPELLDALKKRFNVEDLSNPDLLPPPTNTNSNANSKANSNIGNKANTKANAKSGNKAASANGNN